MKEIISSPQNPKIRNVIRLIEKSSERREQNLIVVEGAREIGLSQEAGFVIHALYLCRELTEMENISGWKVPEKDIFEVSRQVFARIALREKSEGLVALIRPVFKSMDDLNMKVHPLVIVLESVEKPGNLGAVLRTADAAAADAVIICDPRTDLYNPNCIRSSVGCVFTNQVATGTREEVLDFLKRRKIKIFAAAPLAERSYHDTDMTRASAIVMGTEAEGLTDFWLENCDETVRIPMRGKIDSLNVSTSTAILVFEAMRQRGFKS